MEDVCAEACIKGVIYETIPANVNSMHGAAI